MLGCGGVSGGVDSAKRMRVMVNTFVISGNPKGEHLYATVTDTEIILVSHELIVGRVQNQWRDRNLVSMPLST